MAFDIHTISVPGGGTSPLDLSRIRVGMLTAQAIPGPTGELTGAVVLNPGSGYTSIPTAAAANGSGATLTPSMAVATSAIAAAGGASSHSYAAGDTITLTGGTASQQVVLEVLSTLLVSAAVNAGGSGYAVNDTITLTSVGGTTVTPAVLKVATVSTGAVATVTIQSAGVFTGNPTSFTQASTSGSGTGATFNAPIYGVNAYAVQNAGSYSALPSSPVSQGSSSGSGTGFQLTVNTWQLQSVAASGGTGYTNGSAITFTGGAGSGASAVGITNPIGELVTVAVTAWSTLPASYNVQVTPNGACIPYVTGKTNTGFNVTLQPLSSSVPVGASAFDLLLFF